MTATPVGSWPSRAGFRWPDGAWLVVLPVALITILPVLVVFSAWLDPQQAVFEHLREHMLPRLLVNTFWLALGVGVGVGVVGTSLAWLAGMCEYPGRRFFSWGLLLPMAVPAYVMAFAWLGLFDITGVVPTWFREEWGVRRLPSVGTRGGVILVMILSLYPYVYFTARAAFREQGLTHMDVARALGVSRTRAFFRVALPMARPGIVAGVLLALMEALADFGTMAVFNYDTFTTAIYQAWFSLHSLSAASQLASVLVLLVMGLLILERLSRARRRYTRTCAQSGGDARIQLQGARAWLASAWCGLFFLLGFVVPIGQITCWALTVGLPDLDARYFAFAWHTLLLGLVGATLVCVLALTVCYARRLHPTTAMRATTRMAGFGYALPGTVLAVGVYVPVATIDRWLTGHLHSWLGIGLDSILQGTIIIMLVAYAARFLAVGIGPLEAGLGRISISLDEAAQSMGVTGWQRLRRIHFPLLRGTLLTAMLLALVEIMKELPITLMTRPFGWDTLAVRVFEMTSEGEWARAALPALLIVLVGLLPIIFLTRKLDHVATA